MNIVLFRHGHKVFSIDQDPGLSPKGFEQSHHLLEIIENKIIPPPTHVWVSEKKEPIKHWKNQSMSINPFFIKNLI